MSDERIADVCLTAVLDLGSAAHDAPSTLELHGPLDLRTLKAALAQIAADRPTLPGRDEQPRLLRHSPTHHTLRCPGHYPLGALTDLLTAATHQAGDDSGPQRQAGPLPELIEPTPLQLEVLDSASCPSHQVAQLAWRWHGPLDTGRFTAAWQCVFDRETVLRAAFVWDPAPRVALYPRARPDVVRHRHGTVTRRALMERERLRGFDLSRPGMLRAALLDGQPGESDVAPTDVLLTYHRGLLDNVSVRLLLQEFYRAYLASGTLKGGERRPDLRDYRRWLNYQDPGPARHFFTRETVRAGDELPHAPQGAATGRHGTGRTWAHLTRGEAARLTQWSTRWGVTESSVLQAVWAMLLYRAAGPSRGPAAVSFSVTVSGRGIPLEGAARLPGPFDNPLPMTVVVDPAQAIDVLLRTVRDRALDMAAYEWVSAGQIQAWAGGPADGHASLLSFEHRLRQPPGLTGELAAQGIQVEDPDPAGPHTAFPVGVVAYHESTGGLTLASVHDRGRLHDDAVSALLAHSARLLRELPLGTGRPPTVGEVLSGLVGAEVPRLHDTLAPSPLALLRPAKQRGAGTICLVSPPASREARHRELARRYAGPEALLVLRTASRTRGAAALRRLLTTAAPVVLGGFFGTGAIACALVQDVAADGATPPLVVLGTAQGDGVDELARRLAAAVTTRN